MASETRRIAVKAALLAYEHIAKFVRESGPGMSPGGAASTIERNAPALAEQMADKAIAALTQPPSPDLQGRE